MKYLEYKMKDALSCFFFSSQTRKVVFSLPFFHFTQVKEEPSTSHDTTTKITRNISKCTNEGSNDRTKPHTCVLLWEMEEEKIKCISILTRREISNEHKICAS